MRTLGALVCANDESEKTNTREVDPIMFLVISSFRWGGYYKMLLALCEFRNNQRSIFDYSFRGESLTGESHNRNEREVSMRDEQYARSHEGD